MNFTKPNNVVEIEVELGCPVPTLPSEFTPSNERGTELFIRGTEPTTVSTRFDKLSDVSNLKSTIKDDEITLTWNKVETPKINTYDYLMEYFDPLFEKTDYLKSFVDSRMSYNKSHIGDIGYNVYLKDSNGDLKLLDYVSNNAYTHKVDESGDYTFVVKTAYSIFKDNMSEGKTIKASVKINSPIIPSLDPKDEDKKEDSNSENNTENTEDKKENKVDTES